MNKQPPTDKERIAALETSILRGKFWLFAVFLIAFVGYVFYSQIKAEDRRKAAAAATKRTYEMAEEMGLDPVIARQIREEAEAEVRGEAKPQKAGLSVEETEHAKLAYRRDLAHSLYSAYSFYGDNPVYTWYRTKELTGEQVKALDAKQQKIYANQFNEELRATFLSKVEDAGFASRAKAALSEYEAWQAEIARKRAAMTDKEKFLRDNPRFAERDFEGFRKQKEATARGKSDMEIAAQGGEGRAEAAAEREQIEKNRAQLAKEHAADTVKYQNGQRVVAPAAPAAPVVKEPTAAELEREARKQAAAAERAKLLEEAAGKK